MEGAQLAQHWNPALDLVALLPSGDSEGSYTPELKNCLLLT